MINNALARRTLSVSAFASSLLMTACSDRATSTTEPQTEAASVAAATATPTATIEFEVKVPGYSASGRNGWITVSASCGGGGRVVRAGQSNACTDRVARLEPLRVTFSTRNASKMQMKTLAGVTSSNGFSRGTILPLPISGAFIVSDDVTFDNVHVSSTLLDSSGRLVGSGVERRVPIGKRP